PPQQQYGRQQPPPYQQQPQRRQPPPQRYEPQRPPAPEPRRREREPRRRSANPVRIPGLGCLKGCLIMIVLLVVGSWLAWELGLKDLFATGRGYWDQISQWYSTVSDWVTTIGDASKSVGGS
ncbi:hypothetical protein CCS38_02895, partial [Streptomyces purpurogeneiscleroticus]|nr:hypothetical protein [Streptomyces purpurogeneiscleroticus]